MARDLLQVVRQFIDAHDLAFDGDSILVGVSGGADSRVLLDILQRIGDERSWTLGIAHFNHNMHEESAAHQAFVGGLGAGGYFTFGVATTPIRSEADARAQRYRFLTEAAVRGKFDRVAVAHTAMDQAETFLMRLMRGSGGDGLAAMPPGRELTPGVTLIRPLLAVSAAEVREHRDRHDLEIVVDPTNANVDYTRNRIRAELMPVLESFNPKIEEALARAAGILSEEAAALAVLDSELLERAALPSEDAELVLSVEALFDLPAVLRARVLRCAMRSLRADQRPPPSSDVERLSAALALHGPARDAHLSLGVRARCEAGTVRLWSSETEPRPARSPRVEWVEGGDAGDRVLRVSAQLRDQPLSVGPPRPGDRLRPVGLDGTKKLQDLLVDRKIPRSQRPAVLVVRKGSAIVAVLPPGGGSPLAVDESAAPGENDVAYLLVSLE